MQVTVEKVSPVECRLTVVVPADQVEKAYAEQIRRYAANPKTKIDGFRPGKVPKERIEKYFGEEARQKAFNSLIQTSFYEAITKNQLKPINEPNVVPKNFIMNQALEYTASFEVLPDINKIELTLSQVDKPIVEITEQDIDRVIEQLLMQYTEWRMVERAAQIKDRVVIDYHSVFEGKIEKSEQMQNFPLELGSQLMLQGFEEGLLGSKAGEEKNLNLSFPADFHLAERAGKPVDFVVTVKQIFEAKVPELNEEFIKKLGIKNGTEADLRQQIKQTLTQERDRLVKEKVKDQIFRQLLDQNPLEVPNSLVAREAKKIHDEVYPDHQSHDHHHTDEEMTAFNEIAKKRVALGLLIGEYAKQGNLTVDQARVDQRIQEIAAFYENPREVVQWLSAKDRRGGIEAQVLEDQVMDKLTEDAPVTEKSMTYTELKGGRI